MGNIKEKIFGNYKEWANSDDARFKLVYPCAPIYWFMEQKRKWKYMSLDQKVRLVKCIFGFHEPYLATFGKNCWVCGSEIKEKWNI